MTAVEQRKHHRFNLDKNFNAALVNCRILFGELKDISLGGLNLYYLTDSKKASGENRIDIFNSYSIVVLALPCRVVYNMLEKTYSYGLEKWSCGVAFKSLSASQASKLQSLIDNEIKKHGSPISIS